MHLHFILRSLVLRKYICVKCWIQHIFARTRLSIKYILWYIFQFAPGIKYKSSNTKKLKVLCFGEKNGCRISSNTCQMPYK